MHLPRVFRQIEQHVDEDEELAKLNGCNGQDARRDSAGF